MKTVETRSHSGAGRARSSNEVELRLVGDTGQAELAVSLLGVRAVDVEIVEPSG